MFKIVYLGEVCSVKYRTEAAANRAINELLEEDFGWDADAEIWYAAAADYAVVPVN